MDNLWPTKMYGSSTGRAPTHVKRNTVATRVQNVDLLGFLRAALTGARKDAALKILKINTALTKATTPPSLLGIARKIA